MAMHYIHPYWVYTIAQQISKFILLENSLTCKNGTFETKGFVIAGRHKPKDITGEYRIGFDKIPTFQNDDFWNIPEKYVNVIYPDYPHTINVEGDYYEYKACKTEQKKWYLI
jgi:hypothetical protein